MRAVVRADVGTNAGGYTMSAPGGSGAALPGGDSFGKVTVSRSGRVRAVGQMGDGRAFSASGPLDVEGNYAFFATPYRRGGLLGAALAFAPGSPRPTVSGSVRWLKAPDPKSPTYTAGFDTTAAFAGARYFPPGHNVRALTFLTGVVEFSGSDLPPSPSTESVTITAANRVVRNGTIPGFKMQIDDRAGTFRGSFGSGRALQKFQGALLQVGDRGAGVFVGDAESGRVEFRAAP